MIKESKYNYRKLILQQIKAEIQLGEQQIQNIEQKLNMASIDDLARLYDTFNRFGVRTVFDILNE